jgi:hypothetical protein
MPEMQAVESTSIEAIGYDRQTHELYVRFRESGYTYVYWEVEEVVFEDFLGATSKGSYFNREVKGAYSYAQVRVPAGRSTGKPRNRIGRSDGERER